MGQTATPVVAVYCRISKDPQRLEVGVARQRGDCLALAERQWPGAAVRVFVDNDLSAADPTVERPQWRALLDALRAGEIDQVVAYDQSRLTRQPAEWEQLLVVLGRRRIASVHTVREGERDVGEGSGRMVSRIVAAVDAEYVEVTRARIKRALRQLAAEGRPHGGRSFGYRSAVGPDGRKTRVIVAEEAEAVQWAAEQLLAGATLASVAREFERRGLAQVRHGKGWRPTTVRSLITGPAVAGLRPGPDGRLLPAIWPAILDQQTWLRVKAALTQPAVLVRSDGAPYRASRTRRPARRHLLSAGLAFCGVCGAPLTAGVMSDSKGRLFTLYVCSPRVGGACVGIVGHRLEPFVVSSLFERLADPEVARRLGSPGGEEAIGVARELEEVDAELVELATAGGRGEISRGEWLAAREGFAQRAQVLRDRLQRLALPPFGDLEDLAEWWPRIGLGASGRSWPRSSSGSR